MKEIYESLIGHWVTLHSLIAMAGLAIYITSSHSLHLRRHPSASIAWVVALVLLPYATLPLYLIFGIRKVGSGHAGNRLLAAPAQPSDLASLAMRTRQLAAIMALPAAAAYRQLALHEDGAQALQALRGMIAAATRSIDLSTFVFARDALGTEIAALLARRAREGVQVRLLVDGIGAYLGRRTDYRSLSAAGVQVALFVPPLRSSLRGRTNLRNHRKMVVVDGEWLWCGGRNLAAEYFEGEANASGNPPWIDLSFDLRGALAQQAQQQFEQDWRFATGGEFAEARASAAPEATPGAAIGQLIASGPDQKDDTFYTLLISGFFISRKRILIATPYFVPDPTLLMALTLAARRGVTVDLLMPRRSNHRLADMARHHALRELTAAGACVRFLPHMLHAKVVVIDDEVALAGTANLDERSLFLNYELMVSFYEPGDVARIAQWVERRQAPAERYAPQPPSFWKRIREGLLLWLAFQL
ncbi:major cardiolipin synthase ClsA [Sideroxyarcus emersonii]|uniref:Major cardiolipin synthase ClsA n=1 Tax=Sideroxyarcus emersonii TaxID=2764705 RepID=A0AAN1XBX4_9PROT|nr:phospholipase D-like domain-containing protein [Sideroxyarcus emersonii]BCK88528.1 major cardiolipin synthase ClsA [Sideroxyarcus emersonii]